MTSRIYSRCIAAGILWLFFSGNLVYLGLFLESALLAKIGLGAFITLTGLLIIAAAIWAVLRLVGIVMTGRFADYSGGSSTAT